MIPLWHGGTGHDLRFLTASNTHFWNKTSHLRVTFFHWFAFCWREKKTSEAILWAFDIWARDTSHTVHPLHARMVSSHGWRIEWASNGSTSGRQACRSVHTCIIGVSMSAPVLLSLPKLHHGEMAAPTRLGLRSNCRRGASSLLWLVCSLLASWLGSTSQTYVANLARVACSSSAAHHNVWHVAYTFWHDRSFRVLRVTCSILSGLLMVFCTVSSK